MCLVPPRARIGDKIAVIEGARLVYVLRQSFEHVPESLETDDVYQLVGSCFAFGLMDGEGARGEPTEKWRTIVLQ
jgi:hypothetical protein